MKSNTTTITIVPPYDFSASIHSHRYRKYHYDQYDRSAGIYKRAYEIHGDLLVAEIASGSGVKDPRLFVKLHAENLGRETVIAVKKQIQDQFLTKADLRPFYRLASGDKILSKLTKQFCGLKPNWPGDLFECLTRCIISQQINITFADKVEMNYVQKFGKKIIRNGESFFVYPDAKIVSEIRKKDLKKVQFSARKAEYLIDLAREIVRGKIDLESLAHMPPEKFRHEITKIRGVGVWTAECCMMHLGHLGILPRGDIGLHQAIRRFYRFGKETPVDTLLRVADKWKGWESFATYYLWHALTNERMKEPGH